jgi:hypothetical protein
MATVEAGAVSSRVQRWRSCRSTNIRRVRHKLFFLFLLSDNGFSDRFSRLLLIIGVLIRLRSPRLPISLFIVSPTLPATSCICPSRSSAHFRFTRFFSRPPHSKVAQGSAPPFTLRPNSAHLHQPTARMSILANQTGFPQYAPALFSVCRFVVVVGSLFFTSRPAMRGRTFTMTFALFLSGSAQKSAIFARKFVLVAAKFCISKVSIDQIFV